MTAVPDLAPAGQLRGTEQLYVVRISAGATTDAQTTTGAIRDMTAAALLAAMQAAGVLTSNQVAAIEAALPGGGSIIVPIPGASDGYIGLDVPGNALGH